MGLPPVCAESHLEFASPSSARFNPNLPAILCNLLGMVEQTCPPTITVVKLSLWITWLHIYSLFQCFQILAKSACFSVCFFLVSQKTQPKTSLPLKPLFLTLKFPNFVEFVLRSGHLSSSLMPVETAAVSSVGRIPRTNQEGNHSLRYAKKHVGYFLSTLLWRDFR